MSVLKNKNEEKKNIFKKILLPLYIVISLVFILYITYLYIVGVIYEGGIVKGQEQGYAQAVQDLISQAGAKCDPVALTLGKNQVDVVNVACLQKQDASVETSDAFKNTTE